MLNQNEHQTPTALKTEIDIQMHMRDLERLAKKCFNEIKDEMHKFKFNPQFFSAQSLGHLLAAITVLCAEDLAKFTNSPETTFEIFDYLIIKMNELKSSISN